MNKSAKTVMCMALVSCVSVLCVVSPAAGVVAISIGSVDEAWPTDPYLQTFDPTGSTNFGNGVNGTRQAGSTFEVTDTVSASAIFFEMEDEAGPLGFNLRLYEVADRFTGRIDSAGDPGNPSPPYGTLLAEGVGLTDSAPQGAEHTVRFDFATDVLLEPRGSGGYAIVFSHVGGIGGTGSRTISNGQGADIAAGANLHGGGSFTHTVNPDGVIQPFALIADIPEPASLALLGLGSGLMMLGRRQR